MSDPLLNKVFLGNDGEGHTATIRLETIVDVDGQRNFSIHIPARFLLEPSSGGDSIGIQAGTVTQVGTDSCFLLSLKQGTSEITATDPKYFPGTSDRLSSAAAEKKVPAGTWVLTSVGQQGCHYPDPWSRGEDIIEYPLRQWMSDTKPGSQQVYSLDYQFILRPRDVGRVTKQGQSSAKASQAGQQPAQ